VAADVVAALTAAAGLLTKALTQKGLHKKKNSRPFTHICRGGQKAADGGLRSLIPRQPTLALKKLRCSYVYRLISQENLNRFTVHYSI
jgi:hypothetical protein